MAELPGIERETLDLDVVIVGGGPGGLATALHLAKLIRQHNESGALRFILFGEGETGLMVYKILLRYWETTREEDVRPYIYLMSD